METQLAIGRRLGTRLTTDRQHKRLSLLVVDIVGSTGMLRHLGDERYASVIEGFKDSVSAIMDRLGVATIADTGDGFICAHPDVECLIQAACSMYAANAALEGTRERSVRLRCGIHCGEVVISRYGIVGLALYEAVELGNAAAADEIWLSLEAARVAGALDGTHRSVELPRSGTADIVVLEGVC